MHSLNIQDCSRPNNTKIVELATFENFNKINFIIDNGRIHVFVNGCEINMQGVGGTTDFEITLTHTT